MTDEYERFFFKPINPDVRIRFQYDRGPEPRYAVTLEAQVDDEWTTLRSWDNAHEQGHHMHRYTRTDGKQEPVRFSYGTAREAMPQAAAAAARGWEAILDQWGR